jgi:rod shape-determining protein MreC
LVLEQVPQADQISVGDTVVTSGRGGLLPKGLIIGQVLMIEQLNVEAYQQAELQPAVDFRRLESVLVITDFEPLVLDEAPAESNP